jgi:segregation and condensation protein B
MTQTFDHLRLIEAILFASSEPLSPERLQRHLPEEADLEQVLTDLQQLYANRGVNLVRVGKNWAFRTASDLAPYMQIQTTAKRKPNRAAIETLAIISYHQPVTRAEIEEIRGVSLSRGTLDLLLEMGWIKPRGRRRTPGRPVTWGTTEEFLDHFGLESLDDLPGLADLKAAGLLDCRPAIAALSGKGKLAEGFEFPGEGNEEGQEPRRVAAQGADEELDENIDAETAIAEAFAGADEHSVDGVGTGSDEGDAEEAANEEMDSAERDPEPAQGAKSMESQSEQVEHLRLVVAGDQNGR